MYNSVGTRRGAIRTGSKDFFNLKDARLAGVRDDPFGIGYNSKPGKSLEPAEWYLVRERGGQYDVLRITEENRKKREYGQLEVLETVSGPVGFSDLLKKCLRANNFPI